MEKLISVSVGEIALKGLNRKYFEDQLISKMKRAIGDIEYHRIYKEQGKIYIEAPRENLDLIIDKLKKVFGLVYISTCYRVEKDMKEIELASIEIVKEKLSETPVKTFKVESRRSDKSFPMKSPEISKYMGGFILENFEELTVDVHNPDF